jgi:hypothetical protein
MGQLLEVPKMTLEQRCDEEYEQIGSWQVSTRIPEALRQLMKDDFAAYERGEYPMSVVKSYIGFWKLCDKDFPHEKTLEEQLDFVKCDMEKKARTRASDAKVESCYVGQRLIGSTTRLYPDPFIQMESYITGQHVDLHNSVMDYIRKKIGTMRREEETQDCSQKAGLLSGMNKAWQSMLRKELEAGIISTEQHICHNDETLSIEQRTSQEYTELYNQSYVKVTIDCNTRKARIDPNYRTTN